VRYACHGSRSVVMDTYSFQLKTLLSLKQKETSLREARTSRLDSMDRVQAAEQGKVRGIT
jgi:hypothetical protein